MKIHGYASESHYRDHVAAVWNALDPESQGVFLHHDLLTLQKTRPNKTTDPNDWWLVSSVQDASALKALRRETQVILLEHGVGQTYINASGPGCIGTDRAKIVDTFWMPNSRAAQIQSACCSKPVHVIYPHRLDVLRDLREAHKRPNEKPVVVFSFHHHQIGGCPEQRSTYGDWLGEIETLLHRDDFTVVGHAHPREQELVRRWRKMGVPVIERFDEVVQVADVYVCDNSSTIYESAALGIPVVVLHGYSYRPAVKHGLRFYQYANVGLIVSARNEDPAKQLLEAIQRTLSENPQKERAAEISAALFDRSAPTADDLVAQLGRKVTKTVSAPSGWAKALRDIKNDRTGFVKQGQIFRPGFHHTQWEGAAVPGSQTHPKPDAAMALMISNRMAVACEAPAPVSNVEAPAADPIESGEAKPIRRKHHDTDRDPRPIFPNVGGPERSLASFDESVSSATGEKTPGRAKRRRQVLSEPVPES